MEEERTELTRKYFPEIHHKCAEMGLQFVPVDMRWGITAESVKQAQTISICLKEIDRSDMIVGFFGQVSWLIFTSNCIVVCCSCSSLAAAAVAVVVVHGVTSWKYICFHFVINRNTLYMST